MAIFYANDTLTPRILADADAAPAGGDRARGVRRLALAARLFAADDTPDAAARRAHVAARRALGVARQVQVLLRETSAPLGHKVGSDKSARAAMKPALPILQYRVSQECFDARSVRSRVARGSPTEGEGGAGGFAFAEPSP